jgi:hypothetical protein
MRNALAIVIVLLTLGMVPEARTADLAGRYGGDWASSANGVNGAFHLSLARAGADKWNLEVTFTMAGAEVKTTTRSIKVEGVKIQATYDFDLGGNLLRSSIEGHLMDGKLEGTYKTTTVADGSPVDEGTWKAAPAK